jgi:hypothetical protein
MQVSNARAIVYQTYSKHSSENEFLVNKFVSEFNKLRKTGVLPYK